MYEIAREIIAELFSKNIENSGGSIASKKSLPLTLS